MFEQIALEKSLYYKFTFEREEYKGQEYKIYPFPCISPTCTCNTITLDFCPIKAYQNVSLEKLSATIDIDNKKLEEKCDNDKFFLSFIQELSEENWHDLRKLYIASKIAATEKTPDEDIDVSFNVFEIEEEGLMVSFTEILPYGKELTVDIEGEKYIVNDQYCISLDCGCVESMIEFLNIKDYANEEVEGFCTCEVNYKKRSFKLNPDFEKDREFFRKVKPIILSDEYINEFKQRHARLKKLYSIFKRKNPELFVLDDKKEIPLKIVKTGRNSPCPCGSGKKYKKCCYDK